MSGGILRRYSMHLVERIQATVGLTTLERRAVLLLAAALLLGIGIRILGDWQTPLREQSSASEDSALTAGSLSLESPLSAVPQRPQRPLTGPQGPLDLNAATAEELARLPGIGPTLAARILAYRQTHGPFRRLDDLRRVSGIGQKRLERITPHVILGH